MSNYRRLISYIYAYEGGIKGKNVGFAKLEVRNGQCKLQVNVRNVYIGSQDTGVYLLTEAEEILVGKIFIRNGAGEFRAMVSVNNVAGTGHAIDECYGLTVHNMADSWQSYTTIWEDAVAHAAEVALSEATSERLERREMKLLPGTQVTESKIDSAGSQKTSIAESIEAEIEAQSRMEEQMRNRRAQEKLEQENLEQEKRLREKQLQGKKLQERQTQETLQENDVEGPETGQGTAQKAAQETVEVVPSSEIPPLEPSSQFLRPAEMETMEVKPIKAIDPILGGGGPGESGDTEEMQMVQSSGEVQEETSGDETVKDGSQKGKMRESDGQQLVLRQSGPQQFSGQESIPRQSETRQFDSQQSVSWQTGPQQPGGQESVSRQLETRRFNGQQSVPQQSRTRQISGQEPGSQQIESQRSEPRQPESRPRQSQSFRQNWWSPVFSGQNRLNRGQAAVPFQGNQEWRKEEGQQIDQGQQVGQKNQAGLSREMGQEEQRQPTGQNRQVEAGRQTKWGEQTGQGQQTRWEPPIGREQQTGYEQQVRQEQPTEQEQHVGCGQQAKWEQQTEEGQQTKWEQPIGQEQQTEQEQQTGYEQQTRQEQQVDLKQQEEQPEQPEQVGLSDSGKMEDEPQIDMVWQHFYKSYPKIQAFDYKGGCDILTIKPQDIGLLPREVWGYGNNSFLLHGYYNHRYLIFARLNSQKGKPRFLLGVPGHYYSNEKYMASMFGFPNFVLSKIQPAGDGRFGYWYTDIRLS